MQKKYVGNMRLLLLGSLATLAMSVAFISCGEGNVTKDNENDVWYNGEMTGEGGFIDVCYKGTNKLAYCDSLLNEYCKKVPGACNIGFSSDDGLPSSDSDVGESCSSSEDELPSSSSSDAPPSSSSASPSSSSIAEPSSSSNSVCVPEAVLTCELPKTGNQDDIINTLANVMCGSTKLNPPLGFILKGGPALLPAKDLIEYSATASCGGCEQEVSCGMINVGNVKELTCKVAEGTEVEAGEAITIDFIEEVICNRIKVVDISTGFTLTPVNAPEEVESIEVSVKAATGDCEGAEVKCSGSVKVKAPATQSSSSADTSSDSGGTSSSSEEASSSSLEPSSSSVEPSSSSVVTPSSSSSSTPTTLPEITCVTDNSGCYERNRSSNSNDGTPVPRPKVYCDGELNTTGAATFLYDGNAATGWNSPGGTQRFNTASSRAITLSSLVCDGTPVTANPAKECGNVTIKELGECSPTPEPELKCNMTATSGIAGEAIAATATCNGANVTTGITWTPANRIPTTATAAGSPLAVSVSASSGVCAGLADDCGSITVSPQTPTCTIASGTTGTVNVPIAPSALTVRCGTINIAATSPDLAWTPTNLIPTAAGSVTVSVNVTGGSGYCKGGSATCGPVTVKEPGGCGYMPTWCNNLYQKAEDVTKGEPETSGNPTTARCYFVTEITKFCSNNTTDVLVNNQKGINNVACWSNNGTLPAKVDGGYYIYLPAYVTLGTNGFTGTFGTAPVCDN